MSNATTASGVWINLNERSTRRRLLVLAGVACSMLIDALWIGLFAYQGVTAWSAVWLYLVCGVALLGAAALVGASRIGMHVREGHFLLVCMLAATVYELGFLVVYSEIGFVFLMVLVLISAFAMLGLSAKQLGAALVVGAALTGLALLAAGDALSIPSGTTGLSFTVWACFCSTVARGAVVNLYVTQLRRALVRQNEELARTVLRVETLANVDELTGLSNRRALLRLIEAERARYERGGQRFCLAILDLDHFKAINDAHGHLVGDAVLRVFADIISSSLRQQDGSGRYGGEEFLLLLVDADLAGGRAVAERIRKQVRAWNWSTIDPDLSVSVSIGLTAWSEGDTVDSALARADSALYRAKSGGRNRVEAD